MVHSYRPNPITPKVRFPRGESYCDFCSMRPICRLYPCGNFEWRGRDVFRTPAGRWAACAACARLIDSGHWARLVTRVMREVNKRDGISATELLTLEKDLDALYREFGANVVRANVLEVFTSPRPLPLEGDA